MDHVSAMLRTLHSTTSFCPQERYEIRRGGGAWKLRCRQEYSLNIHISMFLGDGLCWGRALASLGAHHYGPAQCDSGLQVLEYEHDYLILEDLALVHTSKSGRSYDRTSRGLS